MALSGALGKLLLAEMISMALFIRLERPVNLSKEHGMKDKNKKKLSIKEKQDRKKEKLKTKDKEVTSEQ